MTLIEQMKERRAAVKAELEALISTAMSEVRDLTTEEDATYSLKAEEIRKLDARIDELREIDVRTEAATTAAVSEGRATSNTTAVDAPVYAQGNYAQSFFRDLAKVQLRQDRGALDNLVKHQRQMADAPEARALGNTNTTGGSGGEFAPPTWLVNEYISLVRPGRVTADLFTHETIPAGTSSINLPKVLTGTSIAPQTTQNTALSQTDLTTGFVGTGFTTLGGKEIVSQQLLDQSAIPFDRVITQDLAAAAAQTVGAQMFLGTGTGANNNSVINGLNNATVLSANQATVTGALTAAIFYSKCNGMLSSFITNRYAPPTAWLMHPRRWYWLMAQVDSQGRPLVVPNDVAFNPIADNAAGVDVAGNAGRFLGLPVYIDPNVPTNLGTGTNQDEVFLIKQDDLWLFESPLVAEAFREPYADSMGVLFRLYCYAGTILNRLGSSIATLNGTGLIAPTF